jgi:hypothetical protein
MYVQQAIHLTLSTPLYYTTRFFQFINTCKEHEKQIVLLPQTLLQKNISTSIDIYYKSLIDIYINHDFLHDICLSKFAANDDVKTCKKCNNSKIIHWVYLNLHKGLDNHYELLLLLFNTFC